MLSRCREFNKEYEALAHRLGVSFMVGADIVHANGVASVVIEEQDLQTMTVGDSIYLLHGRNIVEMLVSARRYLAGIGEIRVWVKTARATWSLSTSNAGSSPEIIADLFKQILRRV